MKIRRIFKSLAAAVLALAVLGAATLNSVVFAPRAEASGLNKGDIIELGSYPQQRVTDEALLSALDSQEKDWISYNYYSRTDGESAGSMESGDWMKYADFTYDGIKYRAVTFSKYMPDCTFDEASEDYSYSTQEENGYKVNNVYYFRYDPIVWCVLDPESGLVMCEMIIDSQPFSEKFYEGYYGDEECYNDPGRSHYANDYATGSIREWLNGDFYNTAFSDFEKQCIATSSLETKAFDEAHGKYDSEQTDDNVFLLSLDEVENPEYDFKKNNIEGPSLPAMGSEYAKCQGLWVDDSADKMSYWYLRTGGEYSAFVCTVSSECEISTDDDGFASSNEIGVRPALRLQSGMRGGRADASLSRSNFWIILISCVAAAVLVAAIVVLIKITFVKRSR